MHLKMSKDEIRRSYNSAKNKNMQIRILADLNGCDKKTIEKVLSEDKAERLQEYLDILNKKIYVLEKEYINTVKALFELQR